MLSSKNIFNVKITFSEAVSLITLLNYRMNGKSFPRAYLNGDGC